MTFKRHFVAKTDGVHSTLGSAEKLDSVHTTHYHTMHVHTTLRLGVVHSVYVAKPDVVNTTR